MGTSGLVDGLQNRFFGQPVRFWHPVPIYKRDKVMKEVKDKDLEKACYYYTKDFHLLSEEDQADMKIEARYWLLAWYKVAEESLKEVIQEENDKRRD